MWRRPSSARTSKTYDVTKNLNSLRKGEWIDLDIDLDNGSMTMDGNGTQGSRSQPESMRLLTFGMGRCEFPMPPSIPVTAEAGNTLRINLFRCQGPTSVRRYLAWRAPMRDSFHVPERFGILKLVK